MYTTVRQSLGAIEESARQMREQSSGVADGDRAARISAVVPLLVDQVMAEAGVVEPRVAARAVDQAQGDTSRAVSLLRSWVSCLPRLGESSAGWSDITVQRRITPAFSEPDGGQYLGASLDYAARLLDLSEQPVTEAGAGSGAARRGEAVEVPAAASNGEHRVPRVETPVSQARDSGDRDDWLGLPRAVERLEGENLVAPDPWVEPVDITRRASATDGGRGALGQFFSRAETGALTALAYTAVREGPKQADPTLVELRAGELPVQITHPDTGAPVSVGTYPATICELALYHVQTDQSGQSTDSRFTIGLGITVGRVERRAVSAAMLDARVRRAEAAGGARQPCDDAEWLITALDGQEATGFVEHLKLAHHVTFAADLDRVRSLGEHHGAVHRSTP